MRTISLEHCDRHRNRVTHVRVESRESALRKEVTAATTTCSQTAQDSFQSLNYGGVIAGKTTAQGWSLEITARRSG